MNALIQAFSRFLGRDIPYILGGSSIILSVFYLFDIPFKQKIETPYILLLTGFSYVIGYSVQDGISLTPIANTSLRIRPNRFLLWLFKRWSQREWKVSVDFDAWENYFQSYAHLSKEAHDPIERIITLHHVGITMGTNWLIVSLVLFAKTIIDFSMINLFLLISLFVLSLLLLLLGWLQGMEKMLALYQMKDGLKNANEKTEHCSPVNDEKQPD